MILIIKKDWGGGHLDPSKYQAKKRIERVLGYLQIYNAISGVLMKVSLHDISLTSNIVHPLYKEIFILLLPPPPKEALKESNPLSWNFKNCGCGLVNIFERLFDRLNVGIAESALLKTPFKI